MPTPAPPAPMASSTPTPPVPTPSNTSTAPHSHFRRTSSNFSSASSVSGIPASPAPNRHPRPYNAAELHQELEREQEAVVNRLLYQIRNTAESIHASSPHTQSAIADDPPISPPPSSMSLVYGPPSVTEMTSSLSPALGRARSPHNHHSRHNSLSARSRTSSRGGSPLLDPTHLADAGLWPATSPDPFMMGGRDEVTFYKTETEMMNRENEMLRRRIRELEDQATKQAAGRERTGSASTAASKQEDTAVSESG